MITAEEARNRSVIQQAGDATEVMKRIEAEVEKAIQGGYRSITTTTLNTSTPAVEHVKERMRALGYKLTSYDEQREPGSYCWTIAW